MQACKTGHAEMVQELMRARVDVDCTDEWGNTGLILAAMHGHTDVVHALLQPRLNDEELLPANPNAQNKWAGTALIEAVSNGTRRAESPALTAGAHFVWARADCLAVHRLHAEWAISCSFL